MALAAAFASVHAVINNIVQGGVQNGNHVTNTAMPASSHVRPRAKWVLRASKTAGDDPDNAALVDSVCWMSRVDSSAADRNAMAADEKLDPVMAVIITLGRAAAWKYFGMNVGHLNAAETHVIPAAEPAMVVHVDHEATVVTALNTWSMMASRMTGVMWYNALSFETANHHHKPEATKRLATTTITLLGLEDFFTANAAAQAEGVIMHDMFHPVGFDLKASLARNQEWAKALTKLNFDNLRKRIPVKASDCGLALNYPVLISKAKTYPHEAEDLPEELNVPAELTVVINRYKAAATAEQVENAIAELRAMSEHLAMPSAYVVGFVLGRERRSSDDEDLTLRAASKTNTILGSPAYARVASEHPGVFNIGTTRGWAKPSKATVAKATAEMKLAIRHGVALAVHAQRLVIHARTGGAAAPPRAPPRPRQGGWFAGGP